MGNYEILVRNPVYNNEMEETWDALVDLEAYPPLVLLKPFLPYNLGTNECGSHLICRWAWT